MGVNYPSIFQGGYFTPPFLFPQRGFGTISIRGAFRVFFVPISRLYMKAVLTFLSDPCADVRTLTASKSNFKLSKKNSSKSTERKERRLARRGT